MSTENNIFESLLSGLPQDDKVELLHSIQDVREQQIDAKLHPRRRRRRNEDGVLEPLSEGPATTPAPRAEVASEESSLAE